MTGSDSLCGACKFLRRKCVTSCVFAPYFCDEHGPDRFAAIHKVYGVSNVSKLLSDLSACERADAVSSIVYEAQARIRDPIYGCVSLISVLQQQVFSLQTQIANLQAQDIHNRFQLSINTYKFDQFSMYENNQINSILNEGERSFSSFQEDSENDVADNVNDTANTENDEMREISITKKLKIFQGNELSSAMVMNDKKRRRLEGRPKNGPIQLSIEEVEEQFGKTMEEAADALGVSRCTLRRWWNKHTELCRKPWQGPKQMKGSKTDENVMNRALIQGPSDGNINQNMVTIKAEYAGEKIVFRLPILQVGTFATLKNEISTEFELSPDSYKLKYLDENEDLIRLSSDKDINYCIQNLRTKVVRVVVLTSP
ncbi:hypothetical protein QVD17_31984 [Tagetes erecta]|uniref:Uncharacterized protein n=1 Tax=Tagetes erecta TaxID=13708 RepID=A0AAD8K4F2_TARER|nr:hypothetical protein QVD17_31984 [Tagetes erecta]